MIKQIVASSFVLRHFSKIEIFRTKLGKNLTGAFDPKASNDRIKIKISDPFVKYYKSITNNIIFIYGEIGQLSFYQDETLEKNEFVAFDGEKIYEIEIEDMNRFMNDPGDYLGETMKKIEEAENESESSTEMRITNLPEDVETPEISLKYKDAYISAMAERRKKLSNVEDDEEAMKIIQKKRKEYYGN